MPKQDNLCAIFSELPITDLGKLGVCSLKRPKHFILDKPGLLRVASCLDLCTLM